MFKWGSISLFFLICVNNQIFGIFLSDYQDLIINESSKSAILEELLSSGGNSTNVAVIELLLHKIGFLYKDFITQSLEIKKAILLSYLQKTDFSTAETSDDKLVSTDLIVPQEAAELVSNAVFSGVPTFDTTSIKQRLLNNVVILEYLLNLLGEDYNYLIKDNLINKQNIFDKIETSALLKTLIQHGYSSQQLIYIINNSSDQAPVIHPTKQIQSHAHKEEIVLPESFKLTIHHVYEHPIPAADEILNIIKELAPELFQLIKDSGVNIIRFNSQYDTLAYISCGCLLGIWAPGLPIINWGSNYPYLAFKQKRFLIAHELAHYALHHLKRYPIQERSDATSLEKLNDSDVRQKTYSRIKEFEADRFAVISLGVSPDDGIAWMEDMISKNIGLNSKNIGNVGKFKHTHPTWDARIEQMKQIKHELTLHRIKPNTIDWLGAKRFCMQVCGN